MKVTGYSFVKNAVLFDYPIVEAIESILPICDDFVIAVGKSEDDTLDLIRNLNNPKIKIIETEWDESMREGGKVLALETDKAFAQIPADSDWAFYIQGDEVVHENYLKTIYENMLRFKDDSTIDGLLFNYVHFYGSYDYVGSSSNWYQKEIRVIKNNKAIYSYKDAQGFRKNNNEKLKVHLIDAAIYHYGWVKDPKAMQKKQESFHKYWHNDEWVDNHVEKTEHFHYEKHVSELKIFNEEHPNVMKNRIEQKNWKFNFDISLNQKSAKDKFKIFLNKYFGIDVGYKNYIIVKP